MYDVMYVVMFHTTVHLENCISAQTEIKGWHVK